MVPEIPTRRQTMEKTIKGMGGREEWEEGMKGFLVFSDLEYGWLSEVGMRGDEVRGIFEGGERIWERSEGRR